MASVNNIIVGGARVYVGPAVPNASSGGFIGSTDMTIAGGTQDTGKSVTADGEGLSTYGATEIGYTSDGIDLNFEPEYLDVEVDQLLDSAILFKTSQKVSFGTTLTEATLQNLARALGRPDSDVNTDDGWSDAGDEAVLGLRGGGLGDFPAERGLIAVANGPRGLVANKSTERIFEAFRAISVESVGVPIKRNEVTSFPVTFRCLPESGGAYMKIADRVFG